MPSSMTSLLLASFIPAPQSQDSVVLWTARWALCALQVSQQELGKELPAEHPTWSDMWQLLERVAAWQAAEQVQQPAAGAVEDDAAAQFEKYLQEAEGVPLTPPPYPGMCWRQVLSSSIECAHADVCGMYCPCGVL